MIDRLLEALSQLTIDAEAIADALYLAPYLPAPTAKVVRPTAEPAPKEERHKTHSREDKSDRPQTPQIPPAPQPEAPPANLFHPPPQDYPPPPKPEQTAEIRGHRVRVSMPDLIPAHRLIAKELQRLRRKVPSPRFRLNVQASVEQAAESGLPIPVMEAIPERWLELALIVDESRSMRIWAEPIRQLRQLLTYSGVFRNVTTWYLDNQGQLHAKPGQSGAGRRPQELIDARGRRALWLISDCVSAAWRDTTIFRFLAELNRHSHVAIVQLLPPHSWSGTALGSDVTLLSAPVSAASNSKLNSSIVKHGLKVPVFTLDHDMLADWARLVSGQQGATALGTIIDPARSFPIPQGMKLPEAAERVSRFRGIASQTASDTAVFLSVLPLSLPIMRLVQERVARSRGADPARFSDFAEIALGGIVRHLPPSESHHAEIYEFHDGVREELQKHLLGSDAAALVETVHEWMGEELQKYVRSKAAMEALVENPDGPDAIAISDLGLKKTFAKFAKLRQEILHRMNLERIPRSSAPAPEQVALPRGVQLLDRRKSPKREVRKIRWLNESQTPPAKRVA